ncbi:MAG: hypothetical protein D3920_07970 [Candidatus Electrothrix sp. AW2]|nr:hypothetical protein [Candidatus Electrothrix gigas]
MKKEAGHKMKLVNDTLYVKIVFFGAAMAGKTEAIKCVCTTLAKEEKTGAALKQLNTTAGRTLLFDFTTVKLETGVIARLFSVSGQNYYRGMRLHSMQETDAVFLVLDAQKEAMERNRIACDELRLYMKNIDTMRVAPVITLVNKSEMPNALSIFSVVRQMEIQDDRWPFFAINPLTGENIERVFKMMKQSLQRNISNYRRQNSRGYPTLPDTAAWRKSKKKNFKKKTEQAWQLN